LDYLKHANDLSDEEVVTRWIENLYGQCFCVFIHFEYDMPIAPSLITKWYMEANAEGMEKLLEVNNR
jgi:hypothetical protein